MTFGCRRVDAAFLWTPLSMPSTCHQKMTCKKSPENPADSASRPLSLWTSHLLDYLRLEGRSNLFRSGVLRFGVSLNGISWTTLQFHTTSSAASGRVVLVQESSWDSPLEPLP